MYKKKDIYA